MAKISDPDARDITFFPKDGMKSTTVQTAILESNRNTQPHAQSAQNPHNTSIRNLADTGIDGVPAIGDHLIYDGQRWINAPNVDTGPISQNTYETIYKNGVHFWSGGLWQDPITFNLVSVQSDYERHFPSEGRAVSVYETADGGISWLPGNNGSEVLWTAPAGVGIRATIGGDFFGDMGIMLYTEDMTGDTITGNRRYYFFIRSTLTGLWGSPIEYTPDDLGTGTDEIGHLYGQFAYNKSKTAIYGYSYSNHRVYWTRGVKSGGSIVWNSGIAIDNTDQGGGRPYPTLNAAEVSVFDLPQGYGMVIRNRHEVGNIWVAISNDMESFSGETELNIYIGNDPVIGINHDGRVYLYITSRGGITPTIHNTYNTTLVVSCPEDRFPIFGDYSYHTMLQDRNVGYFSWCYDVNGLMWATSIAGEYPHDTQYTLSEAKLIMHNPMNTTAIVREALPGDQ